MIYIIKWFHNILHNYNSYTSIMFLFDLIFIIMILGVLYLIGFSLLAGLIKRILDTMNRFLDNAENKINED